MHRRGLFLGVVVVGVFVAAACIVAAPGEPGAGAAWFTRWDANGNGQIERTEFQGPDAAFTRLDANGDGVVAQDELGAVAAQTPPAGGFIGQGGHQQPGPGAQGPIDPAAHWQQMLQRSDANKDGQIAASEFQGRPEMFTRLDRDGNGILVESELTPPPGQQLGEARLDPAARWQQALQRFDANKDGQIAADEFTGPAEFFARMDGDANGILTEAEVMRVGAGPGQGPAGQQGQGLPNFERLLQNCDANHDGMISRQEWPGAAGVFGQLDPDGNGFVTAEDIEHMRQEIGRQPQERGNPVEIFLRMLDKDGDGQVSNIEWSGIFADADVNGDGLLSREELMTQLQKAIRPPAQQPEA